MFIYLSTLLLYASSCLCLCPSLLGVLQGWCQGGESSGNPCNFVIACTSQRDSKAAWYCPVVRIISEARQDALCTHQRVGRRGRIFCCHRSPFTQSISLTGLLLHPTAYLWAWSPCYGQLASGIPQHIWKDERRIPPRGLVLMHFCCLWHDLNRAPPTLPYLTPQIRP